MGGCYAPIAAIPTRCIRWGGRLDGSRIASGSWDNTVQVWDVSSGRLLRSYTHSGYSTWINTLGWSPDGSRVSPPAPTDQTVQVWDVSNGQLLRTYSGHSDSVETLAWSPNGSRIASGSEEKTGAGLGRQ